MSNLSPKILKTVFLSLLLLTISCKVFGQIEKILPTVEKTENDALDEVLNVNTVLVQTGVGVFDKKGQFVNDLKQEDFELLVDGKPVPITFFESNTVDKFGVNELKSDKNRKEKSETKNNFIKPLTGRSIIFLVDDFHLSFDSTSRTQKLIKKFIEQEMTPDDMVVIASPSGKIGFLQQFTNDKTVLSAAVERLIYTRDYSANDRSIPPMSEYEALLISQYDREITDIFAAQEFVADPESKRETVRTRARGILAQAAAVNRGTYSTLAQAIRNSAILPGRKIVFFISDGLLVDPSNTDSGFLLQRITDAATRTNTVIYSLDAKGLEAGLPEGSTTSSSPRVSYRVQSGERFDRQDILSLLADKTGGKFVRNTNDLQSGLNNSVREASQYYLLAWEPLNESGKSQKLREIEVRVKNRPELTIRTQTGYLTEKNETDTKVEDNNASRRTKKNNQNPASPSEKQLNSALNAQISINQLPISLTANYLDASNQGSLFVAAVQVNGNEIDFTIENDKAVAKVDVVGIVNNSEGKREGYFRELISSEIPSANLNKVGRSNIYYNYQTKLKPGLYQMRVAARDVKNGRIGTAIQWIEIPDLSSKKLTLGSLIISEEIGNDNKKSNENSSNLIEGQLSISVDRIFSKSSRMRYLVFVYNVSRNSKPDVTIQTQIFRGNTEVLSSGNTQISTDGQDVSRLPYAAEIPLETLSPGRYDLQVKVYDRNSKTEAVRRVNFEVK